MSVRIAIADGQNLVRLGLSNLLHARGDIEVIAQFDTGYEVLENVGLLEFDILVMDIFLPRLNGIEVLRSLNKMFKKVPTVILTSVDDHDLFIECTQLGAKGYLNKDVHLKDLMSALDCVSTGGSWYQPGITLQATK